MVKDYKIIETPWLNRFYNFIKETQEELFIVTPFFSKKIIQELLRYTQLRVKIRFLLGVDAKGIAEGVSDYEALIFLHEESFQRDIVVKNIPNLHAKIVISDKKRAILSSSNFTYKGLKENIEFGIEISGETAKELHIIVKKYWDSAKILQIDQGVDRARRLLSSFKDRELRTKPKIPKIPIDLGKRIFPMGNDLNSPPYVTSSRPRISSQKISLQNPHEKTNLLFNIWWNDNGFKGPCLDISNKIVCRKYFLKIDGEDQIRKCEVNRNGCDSAYIFTNFAYYHNANLDKIHLNKCAFFIARNPSNNKYWIIGYLFINNKGGDGFEYYTEGGQLGILPIYIRGDEELSLRFQPYLLFNESFIRELSLGNKWGKRKSSELDWITRHTRSSASCIYITNSDAVTILQTYLDQTTNESHKKVVSNVLEKYV